MITSALTLLELQSAIIREPLVVSADATVMEAIALMSSGRSQCDAENHSDNHLQQFQQEARSSCVLVLEDEKLIGVITERDVVRLSAQQQNLNRLLVREVMAHPVVTLRESDLTDLFLAVNLLQQYHIRHLPLLDEQDLLVGMVTHESLRQISRPIDLMRLRLVSEVMTPNVVCAASDSSMLAIAQMMAEQKISSVMIVETCITDTSLQIPVGIVTERDVVQFQALGLNLDTCIAYTVMSTPIFAVKPEDNLLTVQQIMEQRLIRRLAVTGEFGELLGIVTQTSLLQALNPTEIYNLAKILEAKVEQLESEKVTLLKHRNIELERQVHERTVFLTEAEKALQKINQSLELTVQERTQELWQVNKLQRAILDGTDYAIISTDLNGIIQTFNAGAEKMLGYSTEEVIGKITPEIFFDHQELINRASDISTEGEKNTWGFSSFLSMANQGLLSDEWTHIRKDGSRFSVELSVTPLNDDNGKTIGFLSVRKDISDRKQAEKALKESERLFSMLVSTSPVAITRFDLSPLDCIYVNERWSEMTGRSVASAMGRGWLDAVHPDERDMIRGLTEHEFFSPSSRQFMLTGEGRHLRPDGTINWYFSQLVKEFNDSGEVTGYIGTLTDISDRKQAELELQKVSDRLALALNSGAIGCWEWDIQQNILVWDDRMYELYGYLKETNSHMPYEVWANAVHPDDLHTTETILQQAILGQLEFDYEFRVIHPDQSIHFIKAYGKVKRDSQGNAESMIGVNFDVSDRKQSETKLQLANEELKRATRLKDEFLANMSHELRTPLNSILGMNEGLQEGIFGRINERQIQVLQTIEISSTHLLTLINDILDVAKIESGQVTLELTATDINSLCNSSLAFIKQQALTKRIQLIPRIPKNLPEIMLDERRIRQVLINLLNNAVKFTLEGGTITLEVSQVQLESSTTNLTPLNYIKIAVIDTGIGISAENIQKLFQPFIQIDSALNRQYTGTGLGLALVKRLVELHGGTIELTSEVGVGSCFAINLPINIGDPAIEEQTEHDLSGESQIGQSQTEGLISPLILLAEDNEANIATFSSYLEAKGYRILLATDGQQAINFAKAEQPDLILMDIQMPVIDGLEAIKQIRLDPNLVNIPIIALTALAMEGDRDRCLAAGANDYLSKPIKLKQLNLLIQQVLGSVK
ncbi:PAS domain S-box protein [Phormidium tenue]|nr:PAS domain S-box protein [Phormidium tenue]